MSRSVRSTDGPIQAGVPSRMPGFYGTDEATRSDQTSPTSLTPQCERVLQSKPALFEVPFPLVYWWRLSDQEVLDQLILGYRGPSVERRSSPMQSGRRGMQSAWIAATLSLLLALAACGSRQIGRASCRERV